LKVLSDFSFASQIISGVDRIIFATGYRYTYPFLPQYHNASLGLNDTTPAEGIQPIVTDGTHLRSLYLDAFYIPDPTLTFINGDNSFTRFLCSICAHSVSSKFWNAILYPCRIRLIGDRQSLVADGGLPTNP
jgi:hypothetical protein